MDAGTVVGIAGLLATIGFGVYARSVKKENHRLRQQVQGAQGGGQQQQVQEVHGDVVTINNYGPVHYNTETKGNGDGGNN